MRSFVASILLVAVFGSGCFAQDCKNGRCQIVQVPKAVVSQSVEAAKEVASVPAKAVKQVKAKKPVRGFFKRLFRKG